MGRTKVHMCISRRKDEGATRFAKSWVQPKKKEEDKIYDTYVDCMYSAYDDLKS